MGIFDSILMNLTLLMTLTYLWTVLVKQGRLSQQSQQNQLLEILVACLTALMLMQYPVRMGDGLQFDLRMVPLVVLGLRYGPLHAVLAAVPVALYRLALGGMGAVPAVASLGAVLTLLSLGWLWAGLERKHILKLPFVPAGVFLGQLVGLSLLPNRLQLITEVFPVLYGLGVLMTHVSLSMLLSKQKQLKASEEVSLQSLTDPLTLLGNRRKLDQDAKAFHAGNFVLTLDVDHFKRINDAFGHHVGDEVLSTLGTVIRESLGSQHKAYRLGGEEFVVVLKNKKAKSAYLWTEELRLSFTERVALLHPHIERAVTVSAGLVNMQAGEGFTVALQRADALLYQAKQQGRNQTCLKLEDPLKQLGTQVFETQTEKWN
ncbi:GGDEF domain-containing protein [Deinococcus roseus]|uniref:GGDEF domain-containing protein n=1 Tax=Deinococcus roseus TaxID=392414 RepID=A0ABQ2DEY5_9DEIO|nr:diguanylate cyclase [Deinococcus roseus]GGJ55423.1 GGDEF domain-containing protein [Deinococcus roseus]